MLLDITPIGVDVPKDKRKRGVLSAPRYMYKLPMRVDAVELTNPGVEQDLPILGKPLASFAA